MRGIEFWDQMVNSMTDALSLLEQAKSVGDSTKILKLKELLLKLQGELARDLV
jgi:hypothetical protein